MFETHSFVWGDSSCRAVDLFSGRLARMMIGEGRQCKTYLSSVLTLPNAVSMNPDIYAPLVSMGGIVWRRSQEIRLALLTIDGHLRILTPPHPFSKYTSSALSPGVCDLPSLDDLNLSLKHRSFRQSHASLTSRPQCTARLLNTAFVSSASTGVCSSIPVNP